MDLKIRLADYYGELTDEEAEYIDKHSLGYTEKDLQRLFECITEMKQERSDGIDFETIQKGFKFVQPSVSDKKFCYAVCDKCGTKYWYTMIYCPTCWKQGKQISTRSIKVTDEEPKDVIRFSNESVSPINEHYGSCYDCKEEIKSYCRHFGNPDWFCKDFRECTCRGCCAAIKAETRRLINLKEKMNNKQK